MFLKLSIFIDVDVGCISSLKKKTNLKKSTQIFTNLSFQEKIAALNEKIENGLDKVVVFENMVDKCKMKITENAINRSELEDYKKMLSEVLLQY